MADDVSATGSGGPRQNVAVCVRLRPLEGEDDAGLWKLDKEQKSMMPTEQHPSLARRLGASSASSSSMGGDEDDANMNGLSTYDFRFDTLVLGHESTSVLYDKNVYPIVRAAMEGYNGTVFAYGQTGSGKTYTMTGTKREPGVIPRAVKDVFSMIREEPTREYLLRVSYLEIYNETLRDLLINGQSHARPPRILEEKGRVVLSGMHEEIVTSPLEVMALLEKGQASRRVGATDWNTRSSRSHCVFQITIESREQEAVASGTASAVRVSQLNLIDLAGSERAASELARRKEGAFINKSLLTLGTVIAKLTEPSTAPDAHIPYRDSKLTRLLQTSLSGDARVAVICTVTSSKAQAQETLSTLKFGRRCKMVVTKAQRQTLVDDKALLEKYRQEIEALRLRLASASMSSSGEEEEEDKEITTPPRTPGPSDWEQERAAAAREVAEMEETRQDLRRQIDHLTRLILTSRSVAAMTPTRPVLELSNGESFASPVRRGPRMSDLPSRAWPLTTASEAETISELRQQLSDVQTEREAERHVHERTIQALEAEVQEWRDAAQMAQKQNRGTEKELVRLREEHATDEAHREFRELVSTRGNTPEPASPSKEAMHLQARIGALERALAEEKAMRDLTSLPERPRVSPMQARSGVAPPQVPLRSKSIDTGAVALAASASSAMVPGPSEASELQSLRAVVAQQQTHIHTLTACVENWEKRVRQQATMIEKLASLVAQSEEDEDMSGSDDAMTGPATPTETRSLASSQPSVRARGSTSGTSVEAKPRSRHSGILPSDIAKGYVQLGSLTSSATPPREGTSDIVPSSTRVGDVAKAWEQSLSPARARPSLSKSRSVEGLVSMSSSSSLDKAHQLYEAAGNRSEQSLLLQDEDEEAEMPLPTSLSQQASPAKANTDAAPLVPEVHVPDAVRPQARTAITAPRALPSAPKPTQPLPTPPGGRTRTLPTPPSTNNVAALRASLLSAPSGGDAEKERTATRATNERTRTRMAVWDKPPSAPFMPDPSSKRAAQAAVAANAESHAKLQARLAAYHMATTQPAPPPPRSATARVLPLKPAASMMNMSTAERRAHDKALLRELNDLKAMPRVESSRVMYMPSPMSSDMTHERLSAAAYKTDASAYYI